MVVIHIVENQVEVRVSVKIVESAYKYSKRMAGQKYNCIQLELPYVARARRLFRSKTLGDRSRSCRILLGFLKHGVSEHTECMETLHNCLKNYFIKPQRTVPSIDCPLSYRHPTFFAARAFRRQFSSVAAALRRHHITLLTLSHC